MHVETDTATHWLRKAARDARAASGQLARMPAAARNAALVAAAAALRAPRARDRRGQCAPISPPSMPAAARPRSATGWR